MGGWSSQRRYTTALCAVAVCRSDGFPWSDGLAWADAAASTVAVNSWVEQE